MIIKIYPRHDEDGLEYTTSVREDSMCGSREVLLPDGYSIRHGCLINSRGERCRIISPDGDMIIEDWDTTVPVTVVK